MKNLFDLEEVKAYAKYLVAAVSTAARGVADIGEFFVRNVLFVKIGAGIISLLLFVGVIIIIRRARRIHRERMDV